MTWRGWLLRVLLAAVFVALRLKFNREYSGASWASLLEGTAPLPFGHRVLVPWMVGPAVKAGVSVRAAFAATEWCATLGVLVGIPVALRGAVQERAAVVASWVFVPVLCLMFLLKFRWPIFYPWDVPAIACIVWGVALARQRRHGSLVLLAAVGALNRESAILLPLLTAALWWSSEHRKEALRSATLQLVAVVLVRMAIGMVRPIARGGTVDLTVAGMWRIDHNLQWLASPTNALAVLGAFSLLPVVWVLMRGWIPTQWRRLEWVFVPVMAGLMVVANVYEPRAWGEPLVLLYLGVAVGVARWAGGESTQPKPPPGLDRWATAGLLLAAAVALAVWCAV